MREAYEEISRCEEIIYPILDGMEMGTSNTEETETQVVSGQAETTREQQDVNSGNEDEALREANNYVCSEMLECSWSVDPTVNNINNNNRVSDRNFLYLHIVYLCIVSIIHSYSFILRQVNFIS